jgi:hypothetical protein
VEDSLAVEAVVALLLVVARLRLAMRLSARLLVLRTLACRAQTTVVADVEDAVVEEVVVLEAASTRTLAMPSRVWRCEVYLAGCCSSHAFPSHFLQPTEGAVAGVSQNVGMALGI